MDVHATPAKLPALPYDYYKPLRTGQVDLLCPHLRLVAVAIDPQFSLLRIWQHIGVHGYGADPAGHQTDL